MNTHQPTIKIQQYFTKLSIIYQYCSTFESYKYDISPLMTLSCTLSRLAGGRAGKRWGEVLPSGGRESRSPGSYATEIHTHSEICCPVQCHWSRAKQRTHEACHQERGSACLATQVGQWTWLCKVPQSGVGKGEKDPPQKGLRNPVKGLRKQMKFKALKSL